MVLALAAFVARVVGQRAARRKQLGARPCLGLLHFPSLVLVVSGLVVVVVILLLTHSDCNMNSTFTSGLSPSDN